MQLLEKLDNLCVSEDMQLRDALKKMDISGMQILLINNEKGKLKGIITDGDIRRYILKDGSIDIKVGKVSNDSFMSIYEDQALDAYNILYEHNFNHLPIISREGYIKLLAVNSNIIHDIKKSINVKVVVMAGGKGTRLSPLTKIIPKPLVPVGDVTILEKIMSNFSNQGFNEFQIIVNYKKELIKSYINEIKHPYQIQFIDEENYCGTVGGLKLLPSNLSEHFILTNCDIVAELNYQALLNWHRQHNADLTILGVRKRTNIPYGVVTVDDESYITEVQEKPSYNHMIVSGIYVLNTSVLELIPTDKMFDMDQLINTLLTKKYNITCYPIEDGWFDLGQFDEFKKLLNHLGASSV